ncbi:MAG TPA: dNTP triphosphohydrolase, partial [Flavobacteriaceae bacterium]|nr:dNTP triphosphohydrolase [Flavobacteriaceae bacterium]
MNWIQLLSLKRFGDKLPRLRNQQNEARLGFEVDYDRIIFSDSFRSLQDKTQVIPHSKTAFVHTRLTHSLEVSVVARTLGRRVGEALLNKYPKLAEEGYKMTDFGAIVASAALAHDIGNPPFGHSGEKAIGEYFKNGAGNKYKNLLTKKQWQDVIDFEGNANGFRLLNASKEGVNGGLRLSYATLGAFIKYPKESLPKKPTNHIADKKYGIFQAEVSLFNEVMTELGLQNEHASFNRHPLAYLVEAADDICYTLIDFEDGINLGLIEEEYALEYLVKLVQPNINKEKYNNLKFKKDRISYLRALAIGTLIEEAVQVFLTNEEAILNGTFKHSLLDKCKYEAQINDIIKISVEKIYRSREVIEKEVVGYRVIGQLIDTFLTALNNEYNNNLTNYNKLIIALLPEDIQQPPEDLYLRILSV